MSITNLLSSVSKQDVELWVEGSRLRFRGPRGALSTEQREMLTSSRAEVIQVLRAQAASTIQYHPLSHNQAALWFIAQEAPDNAAYNIVVASRILSTVDSKTIREALQGLTDRHSMLRTTYGLDEKGMPVQRTAGSIDVSFDIHHVDGVSDAALRELVEGDSQRPIDLERGPIFRAALYTRAPEDHVLMMVVHHIAADGWSLGILGEDFRQLHSEAVGTTSQVLPRTEGSYADFVSWQRQMLAGTERERLASYWQSRLQPPHAEIDLPSDRPRPARKTYRGATLTSRVKPELVTSLRGLARDHATTLYVVLLSAFHAMLFRLTGTEDLIIGTPTSGRAKAEFSRVVGDFVNSVPLRTRVRGGMAFRELIGHVRQTVHEALDHQDYPLLLMVQQSRAVRDGSRSPLFETFFSALNVDQIRESTSRAHDDAAEPISELRYAPFPLRQLEGQFELALQLIQRDDALDVELRFSTDLFEARTAQRFLSHYLALLDGITRNVDVAIDAPTLTADSRPSPDSIQDLLAELVARGIRLTLDGDELRLDAPGGVVDDSLQARLAKRKGELIAALRAPVLPRTSLQPVDRTGPLPLSFAQVRLWFLDRLQPGSPHYTMSLGLWLRGALDEGALTRALDGLVQRHESLRTSIREENGNPCVEIRDTVTAALDVVDLSGWEPASRKPEALKHAAAYVVKPFDLDRGPMARFQLVRCAADEHLLVICMHQVASDAWSLSLATREIFAAYDAELAGEPSSLLLPPVQYADFAAWQCDQVNSGAFANDLTYWQRELAGVPTLLELPTDRPRPAVQSFRGARRTLHIPPDLLEALKGLARLHDVTLHMLLLGVWQVLLHRRSGQDDIVVGSMMGNRDCAELEGLIGSVANTVVLRGRLDGNPRFSDFLAQVKATVLRARHHQRLPFDRLLEVMRPERSSSHAPIFQVMFTLHPSPVVAATVSGLEIEPVERDQIEPPVARLDLALDVDEYRNTLRLSYEYAADLFDDTTIDRMHEQYLTLLREITADAVQTVRDIALLTREEERLLLDRVNATTYDHDRSECVHELVRRVAERTGESIAVESSDLSLTYLQLDQRANQLANELRARGVGRGALVGVCLDRTSFLPVALLGVLKAGAAYVPLDPSHPTDRLRYTLDDAGVASVVTETRSADSVADVDVPLIFVDAQPSFLTTQPTHAPQVEVSPNDLAYVIYTSGSTGRPKGVEIEHRNLVNLLRAMRREPGISPNDVLLSVTTPSFDIAGLELFLPLITGARTVIASKGDLIDGRRLAARLHACRATIMQATPATWRLLLDAEWEGDQRLTALCGGEALSRDLAKRLLTRVHALWNMYGPTETTIWSTVHHVTDPSRDIPIGHPIVNTTVYVLDSAGRPSPIDVAGELCIGGEGVARGYRRRDELTAERFVTLSLPARAPERVYRTGDVVRLRADLSLEFFGRRDHQVKVRGYRIELGEIESVLADHEAVKATVVDVRSLTADDPRIVAWVQFHEDEVSTASELRRYLRQRLPEFMIPAIIVPVDTFPLTPNGKIDRRALPDVLVSAGATTGVPPSTPTERVVAEIWMRLLRVDRVAVTDRFFELGGHSLLAMQAANEIAVRTGRAIDPRLLFFRTLAQLAEACDGAASESALE